MTHACCAPRAGWSMQSSNAQGSEEVIKFKTIAGLIGLVAMLAFLAVPVIKLHKIPLILVAMIGAGMAIYEFIEGLRNNDE